MEKQWTLKIGKKKWKMFFIISSIGVEFGYKADWVYWLWWWNRDKSIGGQKAKFFSTSFSQYFNSLKDIESKWQMYLDLIEEARNEKQYRSDYDIDIVI